MSRRLIGIIIVGERMIVNLEKMKVAVAIDKL